MKDLEDNLKDWVAAGLIDEDQAVAIHSFQGQQDGDGSVPLVAEVLGYVGALFALSATVVLLFDVWTELDTWAQLLIVVTGTAVFLGAGWFVRGVEMAAIRRLSNFLLALGTVGVSYSLGVVADKLFGWSEASAVLFGALGGSVVGFAIYLRTRSGFQQVIFGLTVLAVVISGFTVAGDSSEGFLGLGIWGLGAVWLVLGWRRRLPPQRTSYALGSLGTLVGVVALGFNNPGTGAILGIATAAGLFAMSVALGSTILLGFGAAGTFVFVPQLIIEFFGDSIGIPLALFIAGVVLVAVSLLAIRLRRSVNSESGAEKSESDPSDF